MTADTTAVMKPWQHGYSIDYLKDLEARFDTYNGYARGPFTAMHKQSIADALHHNRLHVFDWGIVERYIVGMAGRITCYLDVVMARKEAGDTVIDAFTCTDTAKMTQYLREIDEPTWVWIWQENSQQRDIVVDAGFEHVGSKITSFAEIRGLYFREGSGSLNQLFPREHVTLDPTEFIGMHRTPITVDVAEAVAEIESLSME